MESLHATHTILINDLKRKLDLMEEKSEEVHQLDRIRKLEIEQDNLLTRNSLLHKEIEVPILLIIQFLDLISFYFKIQYCNFNRN